MPLGALVKKESIFHNLSPHNKYLTLLDSYSKYLRFCNNTFRIE
jgi:hypothetical protein